MNQGSKPRQQMNRDETLHVWVQVQTLTCFLKLVIVFCMSETKSWKSLIEGSVLFLEVTVTFTRLSTAFSTGLQTQMHQHYIRFYFIALISV